MLLGLGYFLSHFREVFGSYSSNIFSGPLSLSLLLLGPLHSVNAGVFNAVPEVS